MRLIKYIAIHCTATNQNATVESIKKYWKTVKGWKSPGYHFIIKSDGEIIELLPIEQISNGVLGYNSKCINIAYIGGIDEKNKAIDNRTDAQKKSMISLIIKLKKQFPNAIIQGHRDFPDVKKDCPSFDVKLWIKDYLSEIYG
jgi:N-acetylmuramoyl-L-alanine amidase